MKNECEIIIQLLRDKYQSERPKVMQHQTKTLEKRFQGCRALFKPLPGFCEIQWRIKDETHFPRCC